MAADPSPSPNCLLQSLPKAELHLHLEGSVEPDTLIELKRRHGVQSDIAQAESLYRYRDFTGFLMAFKEVTEFLRNGEDYELITYRLMQRLKEQNVLHAEVYVSVGVCLRWGRDFADVFEGLERGRRRGEADLGISLLWIFDATRHFGVEAAQQVAELAAQYRERNVVGFGIGGDETQAGPELFRDVYAFAADQGLRLTVHAGETAGPESIWGALNLKAERIGHALTAAQDPELIEELAERQVPVEICLSSNLATNYCARIEDHPLGNYFNQGLMITLNTDDPAMFRTTATREYQLAQNTFQFSDDHMRELARNSFEASFLPAEKKLQFLNLFDAASLRP
jgi:adenosine deaminase/aminodeoxyfutalosine deaminase